jgi:hypothetical protein
MGFILFGNYHLLYLSIIINLMKIFLLTTLLAFCTLLSIGQSKNVKKLGTNTYRASIFSDTFQFERVNNPTGKNDESWRWAACLTMVLNFNGLSVTQDQVIGFTMDPTNQVSDPAELMMAMNRATPASWGKSSHVVCEVVNVSEDALFDELSANRPMIVGLRADGGGNRAAVVVSITYSIKYSADGQETGIDPTMVAVRDPGSAGQSVQLINWGDFVKNTTVLYSFKITGK